MTAETTKPRRGVYLYIYRSGPHQLPVAHAAVVSGRHVFGISAGSNEARTRQLIRRVAQHLADQGESGARG
ncbi:hypothetical protein OG596_35425 [Streptomyces sp. NBC_01102]|uniref:hypothetical protein n=1 Tax=unclassified Streptomyces TaxID=2593676 RepID=UPI00386D3CE2|nr:hypothetical protein OG596_35425 [Streptomyces sp. NBC_01102]